jgi:hypothetical protein
VLIYSISMGGIFTGVEASSFKAGYMQLAESTQPFQLRIAPKHFPASGVWIPRPKKLSEEIDSETKQDRTSNSGANSGAA